MAGILEENKPKEGDQQQQPPQNQPLQVGMGQSGTIGTGMSGGSQAAARGTSPGGSKFFNIQNYLNANKPGSQQLESGLESKVTGEADKVRAGIQQAQQQFGQQAGAEQQRLQQGQQLTGNLFGAQPTQDITKLTPDQQQQMINLRTGTGAYQQLGDQSQQQLGQLQNQQQQLGQSAAQANTEAGRFQMLGNTFGRPGYAQGQRRLDQLLLQTDPGLLKKLQTNATGAATGVGQDLSTAQQTQQSQLTDIQKQAADAQAAAQQGISGAQTAEESSLEKQAADQTAKSQQLHDILNRALGYSPTAPTASGKPGMGFGGEANINKPAISADELAMAQQALGGNELYNKEMYGTLGTLGTGAIKPALAASVSDVANQGDLDKLKMLSTLGGSESKYLGQLGSAPQLGGYNYANMFDNTNLNNQATQARNSYQSALTSANSGRQQAIENLKKVIASGDPLNATTQARYGYGISDADANIAANKGMAGVQEAINANQAAIDASTKDIGSKYGKTAAGGETLQSILRRAAGQNPYG